MKKSWVILFTVVIAMLTLTGCGKIGSTYGGVAIGQASADRLNAAKNDAKTAAQSISEFKKNDSAGNLSKAKKNLHAAFSTYKDNLPASKSSTYASTERMFVELADDTKSAKTLGEQFSIITSGFVIDATPAKLSRKQSIKVQNQFQKDIGSADFIK